MSVSLLTGMAAKEVVVSTLSVLYTGESDDSQVLTERLKQDKNAKGEPVFTPLIALSFMLFVLIYFPCIATISAIVHESGSWKWGIFVIIYTCVLAWIVSCVVYQTGHFFYEPVQLIHHFYVARNSSSHHRTYRHFLHRKENI
mgnify:CR=1 FL=1